MSEYNINKKIPVVTQRSVSLQLGGILCLSGILLLTRLSFLSFWIDEVLTIHYLNAMEKILVGFGQRSLYYIIAYWWGKLFGIQESSVRALLAVFGILAVWITYKLISEFTDNKTGILSSFILAISPFFILFSRMARYYSLALLISSISLYFFVKLIKNNSLKFRIFYIISTVSLIFTDYFPAGCIILGANLYVLLGKLKTQNSKIQMSLVIRHLSLRDWVTTQIIPVLLLGLHLFMLFSTTTGEQTQGAAPTVKGAIIKLGYLFYKFCFGETILPSMLWIVIPTILIFIICFIKGIKKCGWEFLTSFMILPVAVAIVITSTLYTDLSVGHIPRILFFTAPVFYGLVSAGILELKKWQRWGSIILIILVFSYSLKNYYTKSYFLHPNYTIPWKSAVEFIKEHQQPGDVILNAGGVFSYYGVGLPIINSLDINYVKHLTINDSTRSRIWLIAREEWAPYIANFMHSIKDTLNAHGFQGELIKGYVKLTPVDIFLREKILERTTQEYALTIYLYKR